MAKLILEEEAAGVFAWMVEGCLLWQTVGLGMPAAVKKATGEYREEMDTVQNFLEDCCKTGPGLSVSAADLFSAYQKYSGGREMSKTAFSIRVKKLCFDNSRDMNSRFWVGLEIASYPTFKASLSDFDEKA